jgi:hypothetical protein
MNREDIIRMAREAGFKVDWQHPDVAEIKSKRYEHFAALVAAAEREKLAAWMIKRGYATGHGDTIGDLLNELDEQIWRNWRSAMKTGVEIERQACAKVCEEIKGVKLQGYEFAAVIRARGQA